MVRRKNRSIKNIVVQQVVRGLESSRSRLLASEPRMLVLGQLNTGRSFPQPEHRAALALQAPTLRRDRGHGRPLHAQGMEYVAEQAVDEE